MSVLTVHAEHGGPQSNYGGTSSPSIDKWLPQSQADGTLPSDELHQPAPHVALRPCRIGTELLTCAWEERLENQGKAQ